MSHSLTKVRYRAARAAKNHAIYILKCKMKSFLMVAVGDDPATHLALIALIGFGMIQHFWQ